MIAPAPTVRLLLTQLAVIAASLVFLLFFGTLAVAGAMGGAPADVLAWAGILAIAPLALFVFSIMRFVPVARWARVPATVRVSRQRLLVNVPTLGRRGRREWLGPLIADVSVRHAGLVPGVLRFIRIQVSLSDDRAESIVIPSPGGESLAMIEDNLRDALGLPVFN
jgi:hypothetical protein